MNAMCSALASAKVLAPLVTQNSGVPAAIFLAVVKNSLCGQGALAASDFLDYLPKGYDQRAPIAQFAAVRDSGISLG